MRGSIESAPLGSSARLPLSKVPYARTHTRIRAHAHAYTRIGTHTHAHAHARTRARTHTRTHAHSANGHRFSPALWKVLTDEADPGHLSFKLSPRSQFKGRLSDMGVGFGVSGGGSGEEGGSLPRDTLAKEFGDWQPRGEVVGGGGGSGGAGAAEGGEGVGARGGARRIGGGGEGRECTCHRYAEEGLDGLHRMRFADGARTLPP